MNRLKKPSNTLYQSRNKYEFYASNGWLVKFIKKFALYDVKIKKFLLMKQHKNQNNKDRGCTPEKVRDMNESNSFRKKVRSGRDNMFNYQCF